MSEQRRAHHTDAGGADTETQTGISVEVNTPPPAPPGYTELYTREGRPRLVPDSDVDRALREEGLLRVRYDYPSSRAEWQAAWQGAFDTIVRSLDETESLGYMRAETGWVMNDAMGKARDSYGLMLTALGAVAPDEDLVASVADRLQQVGHLDGLDRLQKHEDVASRYPQDALEAWRKRNAEEDERRDAEAEALDETEKQLVGQARELQLREPPVKAFVLDGHLVKGHPDTGRPLPVDTDGKFLPPYHPETGQYTAELDSGRQEDRA